MHTFGGVVDYSNQLSDKNLLTVGAFYNSIRIQRYTTTHGFPGASSARLSVSRLGYGITNNIDAAGNCYGPGGIAAGPVTCFGSPEISAFSAQLPIKATSINSCGTAVRGHCRARSWAVTENGYSDNFNKVHPVFSAFSLNDNWRPNDQLTFNIGFRVETYAIGLDDSTVVGLQCASVLVQRLQPRVLFRPGLLPAALQGSGRYLRGGPSRYDERRPGQHQPECTSRTPSGSRASHVSDELNETTSCDSPPGLYARPASTRDASWNTGQQNLASFFGSELRGRVRSEHPEPRRDAGPVDQPRLVMGASSVGHRDELQANTVLSQHAEPGAADRSSMRSAVCSAVSTPVARRSTGASSPSTRAASPQRVGLPVRLHVQLQPHHVQQFLQRPQRHRQHEHATSRCTTRSPTACAGAVSSGSATSLCGVLGSAQRGNGAQTPASPTATTAVEPLRARMCPTT